MKTYLYQKNICYVCHATPAIDNPLTNSGGAKNGKHVYKICRRCNTLKSKKYRKTRTGKISIQKAAKKSLQKHYKKQLARINLNYHVKMGHIIKPKQCECGNKKVEGHHSDYSKPLQVIWLCRSCHANLHRKMGIKS